MINFNEPPYMEKSMDYIRKAVEIRKYVGMGNIPRSAMPG